VSLVTYHRSDNENTIHAGGIGGEGGPGKGGGGDGGKGTGPVFGLSDGAFMEADDVSGGRGGLGGKSYEGKGGNAGDGTGPEFK